MLNTVKHPLSWIGKNIFNVEKTSVTFIALEEGLGKY